MKEKTRGLVIGLIAGFVIGFGLCFIFQGRYQVGGMSSGRAIKYDRFTGKSLEYNLVNQYWREIPHR